MNDMKIKIREKMLGLNKSITDRMYIKEKRLRQKEKHLMEKWKTKLYKKKYFFLINNKYCLKMRNCWQYCFKQKLRGKIDNKEEENSNDKWKS